MKKHLSYFLLDSELTIKEFAIRTKKYFLTIMMEKLIGRYLITLHDLVIYLKKNYGICIVLEEDE